MIKHLYVTGDSFAFGQELTPSNHSNLYDFTLRHRKLCYSGIIADTFGITYKNNALPGGSNERNYRTLITDISKTLTKYKPSEIFVNISLTHSYRREFFMKAFNDWYPYMATCEPKEEHRDHHALWELFSKSVNTDLGNSMFDIMNILGMQNFLLRHKIPYLFTSSMGNAREAEILQKNVPAELLNGIYRPRFYDVISFNTHTGVNNYPRGSGGHPLREGHRAWAEHLLEHINTNNLLDNSDLL
jgi:hypothetical protein